MTPSAEDCLDQLDRAGEDLALIADRGQWSAPVPTCPGWTIEQLVRHVGTAHRWAADVVGNARNGRHREMFALAPIHGRAAAEVPRDDLPGWLRAGLGDVLRTLRAAPADLDCWTFLPGPGGRDFWARRQLHETSIHLIDAQLALGPADQVAPVPDWVGADGADELLTGFIARAGAALRLPEPRTLAVVARPADPGAADPGAPATPGAWLVTIGPEEISAQRDPSAAELAGAHAAIAGTPHDVYCAVWNRPPIGALAHTGDEALIQAWHEGVRI